MKNNLFTKFVNLSYGFRLFIDNRILYPIVKKNNDWSILDKYKGKDVLVVGNGPSLNKTKLDRINMVSIGMNKINLLYDKTSWRPSIITCVNGLVIKQNKDFFNTTDSIVILPTRALYLGVKKRKNVLFVKSLNTMDFQKNIDKGIGFVGSTVTYTALQIAAYLNPSSVNIVGVDHYFKNYTGKAAIEKYEGNDTDHFDPNYFKGQLWGLPDLEGSELAYNEAKKYFEKVRISVTDYTIDGKLEIFKKSDIIYIYKGNV